MLRKLLPCKKRVFKRGLHIATLDARAVEAEAFVQTVAAQARARVDWHYGRGLVIVKALGRAKTLNQVARAIKDLAPQFNVSIMQIH